MVNLSKKERDRLMWFFVIVIVMVLVYFIGQGVTYYITHSDSLDFFEGIMFPIDFPHLIVLLSIASLVISVIALKLKPSVP